MIDAVSHLKEDTLLRFRVGPFRFSVPAVEVEGIIVPPELTVIPLNPPHSKGVFLFHQRLASAISLRSKFGLPDHDDHNLGQLVLGDVNIGLVGFWVDEVYETVDSAELEWRSMPEFVPHDAFESFAVRDDEIVMASTMQKLYDVPAEKMSSMLASMRQSFNLPEDIPPAVSEGLLREDVPDDEDTFGDLVNGASTEPKDGQSGHPGSKSERESIQGNDIAGDSTSKIIEFPNSHEVVELSDATGGTKQGTSTVNASSATHRVQSDAALGRKSGIPPANRQSPANFTSARDARRTNSNDVYSGRTTRTSRPRSFSGGTYAGSINRFQHENSSVESSRTRHGEERSSTAYGWLLLLLLLLFALGVAYWLWPFAEDGSGKRMETRFVSPPKIVEPRASQPAAAPGDSSVIEPGTSTTRDSSPGTFERESGSTPVPARPDQQSGEIYRLEGKDVTVTVERNQPENPVAGSESTTPTDRSTAQAGYHEFTHIVVKGDTLWDIASTYLKDPFRYPELARLSEIKNPDLIYPGDTVRIRTREAESSN